MDNSDLNLLLSLAEKEAEIIRIKIQVAQRDRISTESLPQPVPQPVPQSVPVPVSDARDLACQHARLAARALSPRTEADQLVAAAGAKAVAKARADTSRAHDNEEFSNNVSLVSHNDFGTGPIRHRSKDGKFYHGLNNHSLKNERPDRVTKKGNKTWNHSGKFLHCHFAKSAYATRPSNPQWDHNAPHTFCNNHETPIDLNARRTACKIYRCLGH